MSDLFGHPAPPPPSAVLSPCGQYRYRLERWWRPGRAVAFIMCNPSRGDAEQDDPTLRRCMRFASRWGFDGMLVGNIFALRSPHPSVLYEHPDPVGPLNDQYLRAILRDAAQVVCAWGQHGTFRKRGRQVLDMVEAAGITPYALIVNPGSGMPGHPLYIEKSTEPRPLGDLLPPL